FSSRRRHTRFDCDWSSDVCSSDLENIMFGGAFASIPNLVPSDIEIRRNHITKPLSWKANEPTYAGKAWTIKNLLELKNAQRVLIDRKSTRLNSSHSQISYAVFCLK